MTWDELKKKAKELGYRFEGFTFAENIWCYEELWNADTRLHFKKNGEVYYWSVEDSYTLATNRTYDQMYQIMMLLRKVK